MTDARKPSRRLSGPRRIALGAIVLVLGLSVAARAFLGGDTSGAEGTSSSLSGGASGLVGGGRSLPGTGGSEAGADGVEQGSLEAYLPFVTEGSFFALIGFALGFATRKAAKLALLFVALVFALLQGLSYADVVSIDWNRAVELLNDLVFNLKTSQPVTEILKDKLPTTGGFLAGFLLGFRRG